MAKFRKEKAGDLLQGFLAGELRQLADPIFHSVTITAVHMSPDLRNAAVFWSALVPVTEFVEVTTPSAEESSKEYSEKLNVSSFLAPAEVRQISRSFERAKGLLKRRIGEELQLRFVPELKFNYDSSLETGSRIEFLLNKAGC